MKNKVIRLLLISSFLPLPFFIVAQNVGIGTLTPSSKLQIIGSADTTQLIIDANSTQSNTHPLIKLRNSSGSDLMWIHSDVYLNLFIGVNAGRVNTGIPNTFIGCNAGYSNTIGGENVASGYQALYSNTMGFTNIAFGNNTLYSNVTGNNNVAIGDGSLYYNVAGSNATAIGRHAMLNANDSATPFTNFNVALGYEALKGNSLPSLNTGNYNTALGSLALWSNTTGSFNNASGFEVLYTNTTGESNTANGANALFNNNTGSENTANGFGTMQSNVAGNGATAVGTRAMQYAYNGSTSFTNDNVAVGFEALKGSVVASANTGSGNTTIGYKSLTDNTTGNYNTVNGTLALSTNDTGSGNVANGYSALYVNTSGTSNTAVGQDAGYDNTTGNHNTFIGSGANIASSTQRTNATAIGYNAKVNASNALVLGGTGIDAVNVGIGISSPNYNLHIHNSSLQSGLQFTSASTGTSDADGFYVGHNNASGEAMLWSFENESMRFATNGTERMRILANGKVGIGTTTPGYPLEVTSAEVITGNFINTATVADYFGVYGTCTNTPFYGIGVIGSGGYIGVKGEALLVGTGSRYGLYGDAAGGGVNWAVYSNGSSYATGTWVSSDEMFKKDIHPIENAVDKLKLLEPRAYNFKTEEYSYMRLPAEPQFGFVAQDMEKVFPELVRNIEQPIDHSSKEKGVIQFKGINYTELIPVTIAAFQEQQKTIEELKDQVEQLLLRIETLEKK